MTRPIARASSPCTSTGKITKKTTTSPSVAPTDPRAMTMTRRNANTTRARVVRRRPSPRLCAERHPVIPLTARGSPQLVGGTREGGGMDDVYVRPDVWTLDPDAEGSPWDRRLVAYARAVAEMQRRSPDDPTSWAR